MRLCTDWCGRRPTQLCASQAPAVSMPLLRARHSRLLSPGCPGLTAGLLGSRGGRALAAGRTGSGRLEGLARSRHPLPRCRDRVGPLPQIKGVHRVLGQRKTRASKLSPGGASPGLPEAALREGTHSAFWLSDARQGHLQRQGPESGSPADPQAEEQHGALCRAPPQPGFEGWRL